jgi:uncharacterized SAM-binding protein YcdF (DUF218 family)
MTEEPAKQHWLRRWWVRLLILAVFAVLMFFGITAFQVVHSASQQELHRADALVVFGAAEYYGRPSPVLRARLNHAFDLYQLHLAPVIITTGGAADDPKFSEGGVGEDHLRKLGVPESALIAETQGSNTAESARRVAVIMHANGLHSCIAVSDAYHVFRIRKLLEHEGVGPVYIAPRPDSRPHSIVQRAWAVLRESTSYLFWRMGIT